MKILISLSVLLVSSLSLLGQVEQESRVMSKGSQPAFTLVVPGVETKFVESEWKDYTKSYGKISKAKGGKEYVIEGARILVVGGVNALNLYALAESTGAGTKVIMWIEMGSGFINKDDFPKETKNAEQFLEKFAQKIDVDQIENDLEGQQKIMTKYQSNLTKLQHENEVLHKTIEDAKAKIAAAEESIATNLISQESAQKEIDGQQTIVDSIKKKLDEAKGKKPN